MKNEVSLKVKLGKLSLNNPIVVASGTFGSMDEYLPFVDYNKLGAIITKSITLKSKKGNPSPRIWEVESGMLNAIGLENKGLKHFIENNIEFLKPFKMRLIVSIAGNTVAEYVEIAKTLNTIKRVDAIEVNVSCPNVKKGGVSFIYDNRQSKKLIEKVRAVFNKPIFIKISPEASDFFGLIEIIQKSGCDGVSMINTLKGMAVDIKNKKPRLGNITGGLSGAAIKPVALRYLFETKQKFNIPVIAGGGIMNFEDALEFFIVGAEAVSLGTANFVNPGISMDILNKLEHYLIVNKIKNINNIISTLRLD